MTTSFSLNALAQRTVVITGGTRGIGLATAQAFASQGDRVYVLGRSRPSALPDGLSFVRCDVTDPASVHEAFASIRAGAPQIDVLVNSAGLAGGDSMDDPDEAAFQAIIDSNLTGTWRCTAAALPAMSSGGRIVCVSSVLGLKAVPDQIAYTAAKHGVIGLMKSLALALAPRGITVNAVCPGWVETNMARSRFAELGITAAQAAQGVPSGKIVQAPEVAALIMQLAQPGLGNLTGQAIALDGGVCAG
jgi:NAD(P)-dependent dehydrogenase (short-subunit alcohol dehydrogenase family)